MSLRDLILGPTGMGRASLRAAYLDKKAPDTPGVYKVYYQNQLMKVGKAEGGLRKRFSDYYRGSAGGTAGLKHITENNRDDIKVSWKLCKRNECRALEVQWYNEAISAGESLPWSERR